MAETLANNGTALTRADIYYNDNGTIKTIDDMEVYRYNDDGNWYMFPQKDYCKLNLDFVSFSLDKISGASTHLSNDFQLWQNTTQKNTLGDIVSTDPRGQTGFKINPIDKYWFINDIAFTNLSLGSGVNLFENQQITISTTIKFAGTPTAWRDLWVFKDNDMFRLEWNSNGCLEIFGESSFISGSIKYPVIDFTTNYVNITVVYDNRTIKLYKNGSLVTQGNSTRDLRSGVEKVYICTHKAATSPFGCGVYFQDFAIWKTALTELEINNYLKHNFN